MKPVAIVGLEACYDPHQHLDGFAQAICAGRPLPAGSTVGEDSAASLRRAAENALLDAEIPSGWHIGLMAGGEGAERTLQPYLNRRFTQWTIKAPSLATPPEGCEGLASTLNDAVAALAAGQAEAVLVVAADPSGAGAMVLCPADKAPRDTCYAVIESLGLAQRTLDAWSSAFTAASLAAGDISYLEMLALPESMDSGAYRYFGRPMGCALSSGAGSSLGALIKAAICLRWRMLPPLPNGQESSSNHRWADTPFYFPSHALPWFVPESGRRRAAVCFQEQGNQVCLLVADSDTPRAAPAVRTNPDGTPHYLLPVAGDSPAELLTVIRSLQQRVASAPLLDGLAHERFGSYQRRRNAKYAVVLAGHDAGELQHEINFALQSIPEAFDTGQTWNSPRGSYFTARPLGPSGLTFVYPGAFNVYVGLGRDLFMHFPGLHEVLAGVISNVGRALSERYLYPRAPTPPAENDTRGYMEQLAADPAAMIESGIMFAVAFTSVLRRVFGIRPRSALGYSLGEVSMLWAGGVWSSAEESSAVWRQSPLFRTRLFGPKEAVREAWGAASDQGELWCTYLLKAPLAQVQACLADETRVYVTMVNLPDEVVIGGEPDACRRVISSLHCHALPISFDSVLHNATMRSELPELARLYSNPVTANTDITFYSAAHYRPLTLESSALAHDLASMTCEPLDFPRLVEAAYAGGARLFVELGPQATCTRWIDRLLQGRSHAAVAINRPRTGDYEGVLAVLACLVSHRVPVDLAPLFATNDRPGRIAEPSQEAAPQRAMDRSTPELAVESTDQVALLAESHQAFLQASQALARHTAELIHLQTVAAANLLASPATLPRRPLEAQGEPGGAVTAARRAAHAPVLDEAAVRAFTLGRAEACFGPAYAVYRGRRLPCLPNGDLQLVTRAISVDGTPGKVEAGASLVSQYDVPGDAWFLRNRTALPYAALMEMALQPCGLLSGYLGTTLPYSEVDFYFRNLDGSGRLLRQVDVRGKTLTNRVRLTATSAVRGMIIQQFDFELASDGEPFYSGSASFGYFTQEALVGRNRSRDSAAGKLYHPQATDGPWLPVAVSATGASRLDLLRRVSVSPDGGRHGHGHIFGEAPVRPSDWYFKCHFFQDPVMPGSLGVEAIRQAMEAFAFQTVKMRPSSVTAFEPAVGLTMTWKYRGQITPQDRSLGVEVDFSEITAAPGRLTLVGNARAWNGEAKVYEVDQIGMTATLKG
jgi:PfaB family protein